MINERDKNYYKSIKAPQGLKERILADSENAVKGSSISSRKYIQIAACLLLAVTAVLSGLSAYSSPVYVNGDGFYGKTLSVYSDNFSATMQRAYPQEKQTIEIDANIETEISVSKGEFTLLDFETGEIIYSGNKYSVKGKVLIQPSFVEGEEQTLTLKNPLLRRTIVFENESILTE